MLETNFLIEKAAKTHHLNLTEITSLLADSSCEEALCRAADTVRHDFVGDGVHLRGLIEFSNICRQDCMYCGLRRDNEKIERYRLTEDEIVRLAEKAKREELSKAREDRVKEVDSLFKTFYDAYKAFYNDYGVFPEISGGFNKFSPLERIIFNML